MGFGLVKVGELAGSFLPVEGTNRMFDDWGGKEPKQFPLNNQRIKTQS